MASTSPGEFTVEMWDRAGAPVAMGQLTLSPRWYAAAARGGPDAAEIAVAGRQEALWQIVDWLGFRLQIRNAHGTLVWWGFVARATVGMGAVQMGRSLEGMTNRLQVAYTLEDASGAQVRGDTPWAQHTPSVAAYGRFEARLSLADADESEALATRDAQLAARAQPLPVTELSEGLGGLLTCRGWWATLERQFHADDRGIVEHRASADGEQVIGWALLSQATIGFRGERIDDLAARLGAVRPRNMLRVVGSDRNDGLYVVRSAPEAGTGAVSYTSNAIFFDAADDIKGGDLAFARLGSMIHVTGSAQGENNGTRWITKKNSNGELEVEPNGIVDETDVGAITIRQGHGLTVDPEFGADLTNGELTTEHVAWATPSLYHGAYKVAQRFRLPSAVGWTAREVRVQACRVGSPADNLRVRLYWGSDVEPVGVLAAGVLAPANVPEQMGWLTFDLGAGAALLPGVDYWLSVDREGAPSTSDFYLAGVETAASYAYGLKVQEGATGAWTARLPDAHMPFVVSGRTQTTAQLAEMLAAGDWVTAVSVRTASGVETAIRRDGEQTLLSEVERLLAMGTAGGGALTARLLSDRSAVVEAEEASGPMNLRLAGDGSLREPMGQRLEEGLLPVGRWVTVDGAPAGLSAAAHFLVERAEYDVAGGRLRLEPKGRQEGPLP